MAKKRKKKSIFGRPAFWVISLLILAAFISGWWLWRGIYVTTHRFDYVLITVDNEPRKILSGETFHLHPKNKVKILKIYTNVPFNYTVRLVAKEMDINALRYNEKSISALLPDNEMFDHYSTRIYIKDRNQDLGFIDLGIRPHAEDWLDKANRIIDKKRRLALLERASRLLPEEEDIRLRLLEEYRSQKLWKKVAPMLEDLAKEKSDRDTLLKLLDVYAAMNRGKGVISVLQRLIDLNPGDLELRNELAEFYQKQGDLKSAVREYEALVKRMDKEDRLPVYKRLGYLCAKAGMVKKAISFYLNAVKLEKRDANLYYNLSYLYEKIKQKEKADFYLNKAVSLKSEDVGSRLKLARRLIDKQDFENAEMHLRTILKEKPGTLSALLMMALVMEKQGKKDELKQVYEKILSLDPENDTVIYNLGALEYGAGNLTESLDYFKRYLKSHPGDTAVHKIVFDIYQKLNDDEMAFYEAQILIDLKPQEIEPYHYVFSYLSGVSDYEKIISVIEKGVNANPDRQDLREYLVLAYVKTGEEDLAIQQIEEILKARPTDIDLLLHLARLLEKKGRIGEALNAYKRIIDISPDHEEAEEGYLRLRMKGVRGEGAG